MKKQFTKAFALILMGIFATTTAFAQGKGGHSHTTTDEDPVRGADWEVFHFPKIDRETGEPVEEGGKVVFYDRHYYNGGKFDNLSIDKFPGFHWMGKDIANITSSNEIYFCNVATGEYLQVGDYWGENSMTNHAGIRYTLVSDGAKYSRSSWAEFKNQDETVEGYWICPKLEDSSKEGRCIGRMHVNDGVHGHFEFNRYLALRDKNEYSGGGFPGGFVFQFHPVTTSDGKQAYIIYTHRQTSGASAPSSEYWDRDSYLLLRSANKEQTGYHTARFRKFAGLMYGRPGVYPASIRYDSDKDKPLGDEKDFVNDDGTPKNNKWGNLVDGNKRVARAAGLELAAEDPANLWKIVTKEERERFRLVASEDQPVDMTYRIKNPKFYTAYSYTRTLKESSANPEDVTPSDWDSEHNHYSHANKERDFGWEWFDVDRETHYTNHHIHPWNQHKVGKDSWNPGWFDPEDQPKPRQRELHKVGTGDYYRFNTKYVDHHQEEMMLTNGLESNYVGSIWKGTTNLQQTIGTGKPGDPKLREGLYLVAVKGFYAPHDMLKYHKSGDEYKRWDKNFENEMSAIDRMNTGYDWYKEAIVTSNGPDKGKWKRSHDSYLFAWSYPEVVTKRKSATQEDVDAGRAYEVGQSIPDQDPEEVRRMLPSIYEGAVQWDNLSTDEKKILSKAYLLEPNNEEFLYTEVGYSLSGQRQGHDGDSWIPYTEGLKDDNNIAIYGGEHFSADRYDGWNYNTGTWAVPKSLIGAGHWFNGMEGIDENSTSSYKNLASYRIALPVYVGPEGILTLGVDHTQVTKESTYVRHYIDPDTEEEKTENITIPKSNDDEWVCFDDFELIYLGKDESELFLVDELNGQGTVGGYEYINGETGFPFTLAENEAPYYKPEYVGAKSPKVKRQNNTKWLDIFDTNDITNEETIEQAKVVKNVVIRRSMTTNGWNSIVLPVALTRAQVEEGFGEGTMVSQLETVRGRTLIYKPVTEQSDGTYLVPGFPYIINPTKEPYVPAGEIYERDPFTIKVSTTTKGVAGLYFKSSQYERNYEIDHEIEGPIYLIPNVLIKLSDVFVNLEGPTGSEQWTPTATFVKDVNVRGDNRSFKLKEKASYENPGMVEQYSYYFNKGQIRYATESFTTTKGLFAYVQLTYKDGDEEIVYDSPFIDEVEYYYDDSVTTGIDETYSIPDVPLNLDIYDLQGRKVKTPKSGNIYIMNGKKVVF